MLMCDCTYGNSRITRDRSQVQHVGKLTGVHMQDNRQIQWRERDLDPGPLGTKVFCARGLKGFPFQNGDCWLESSLPHRPLSRHWGVLQGCFQCTTLQFPFPTIVSTSVEHSVKFLLMYSPPSAAIFAVHPSLTSSNIV
jgi:hypothetical protein